MQDKFVEVLRVRGNGQITLPAALRRAADLNEGDTLALILQEDGSLLLKPVVVMDRLEADLLLRLQLRDVRAITTDDLRARARELQATHEVAATSGDQLASLVDLLQAGYISRVEFIGRALTLGLPISAIDTLLSASAAISRGKDANGLIIETPQEGEEGREEQAQRVRICQAFQSLLYLPLYIAHDVGFFQEEGLEIDVITAGGGPEAWSTVLAGAADYSIHDPVFTVMSLEKGVQEAVVVAAICNGEAIAAAALDPQIQPTDDPREFMTRTIRGKRVATQPAPDSQWAMLKYLDFLYGTAMGRDYQNKQVTIGTELKAVLKGEADIGTSFPPQVEVALAEGLHEVFDFSRFFGPFALSALCTTRSWIAAHPHLHQAVINAFEKACQYAYAFPDQAIAVACREFSEEDPDVIAAATRRCLQRLFIPQHAYMDAEAWRKSQILNKFVGTIARVYDITECVNNEAALHAYRTLGWLKARWDAPRPIVGQVVAGNGSGA
jgi:AbrB family looped-hinge helix DNA binding protein